MRDRFLQRESARASRETPDDAPGKGGRSISGKGQHVAPSLAGGVVGVDNTGQGKTQQCFQHDLLTLIFGRSVATLTTRIVIITISVGTLAILTAGLLTPSNPTTTANSTVGLQVGHVAPNFTLSTLNGKKISLSDYRGKPVMLNFWYSNCPGCLAETNSMQKTYATQQMRGKDLVMLGIDTVDDLATTEQFIQQNGITYQIVLDNQQRVATLYNLPGTPISYFIDRQGIIRATVLGPIDNTTLQQDIAAISS